MIKHGTHSGYTTLKCRCRLCTEAAVDYQRQRRLNRPDVVMQNRKQSLAYMKKMREYIKTKKDKPCADCNIKYPYYVMHFDHLGIEPKLFNLARVKGKNAIDTEIKKCQVVCANCHAERTYKRLAK